jgi:hypothetical protein
MKGRIWLALFVAMVVQLFLSAAWQVAAQESEPAKQNTREQVGPVPKSTEDAHSVSAILYSYEFSQPAFYLKHIVIKHDQAGHGQLSFEKLDGGDPITEPVEVSKTALARITSLWDSLHFLESETNYQSEKQFPHMGTMRLRMTKGASNRVAEFNWTNDKTVAALVQEYQHISNQTVFVFDITLARQNQPLEAPKLMDGLETMVTRKELSDPLQLVPLLEDLANDEHIPLMARNHATRILKKIQK